MTLRKPARHPCGTLAPLALVQGTGRPMPQAVVCQKTRDHLGQHHARGQGWALLWSGPDKAVRLPGQ